MQERQVGCNCHRIADILLELASSPCMSILDWVLKKIYQSTSDLIDRRDNSSGLSWPFVNLSQFLDFSFFSRNCPCISIL